MEQELQNQVTQNTNPGGGTSTGWSTAIVIDVSMNYGEDPEGKNSTAGLGWVKFRRFGVDDRIPTDNLEWAKPFSRLTEYPLKGEIVAVINAPTAPSTYTKASDAR